MNREDEDDSLLRHQKKTRWRLFLNDWLSSYMNYCFGRNNSRIVFSRLPFHIVALLVLTTFYCILWALTTFVETPITVDYPALYLCGLYTFGFAIMLDM